MQRERRLTREWAEVMAEDHLQLLCLLAQAVVGLQDEMRKLRRVITLRLPEAVVVLPCPR